jgi:hypothetical protein
MKVMEKLIKPFIAFLSPIIDKYGTKFLVVLGTEGAILYLAHSDKVEGLYAVIAMAAVAIAYFFARHIQEINKPTKKENTP